MMFNRINAIFCISLEHCKGFFSNWMMCRWWALIHPRSSAIVPPKNNYKCIQYMYTSKRLYTVEYSDRCRTNTIRITVNNPCSENNISSNIFLQGVLLKPWLDQITHPASFDEGKKTWDESHVVQGRMVTMFSLEANFNWTDHPSICKIINLKEKRQTFAGKLSI